jgi:hypothetical protein
MPKNETEQVRHANVPEGMHAAIDRQECRVQLGTTGETPHDECRQPLMPDEAQHRPGEDLVVAQRRLHACLVGLQMRHREIVAAQGIVHDRIARSATRDFAQTSNGPQAWTFEMRWPPVRIVRR